MSFGMSLRVLRYLLYGNLCVQYTLSYIEPLGPGCLNR
jgi:hypothetical protein